MAKKVGPNAGPVKPHKLLAVGDNYEASVRQAGAKSPVSPKSDKSAKTNK